MSTIVVVRVLLLLMSGGMVMTGTTVWMLEMNVSFTRDVTSLKECLAHCVDGERYVDLPTPCKQRVSFQFFTLGESHTSSPTNTYFM